MSTFDDNLERSLEINERLAQDKLRREAEKLPTATGRCLFCHEPAGEGVKFCDNDCRDDYEKWQKLQAIRGDATRYEAEE